ncbi:hypothetical protein LX32DRAFT_705392 [Colletotrichum zoysiae]|uniref:Uncharacterized protein n=1 Tax=Colletotrichum zoysiae TaxID=1216348 RepID=A0AAD9H941_9PEZI|nr:hypothetical protein LX32DRAFT_705392 [Colletotrichum zoysiae]
MNQAEVWTIDDASDFYSLNPSSSDSETSDPAPLTYISRLRPAGSALTFVPYANWELERLYDGELTIRYNMEWKLFVKNRGFANRKTTSDALCWKTNASENRGKKGRSCCCGCLQVGLEEQKEHYRTAQELTLAQGYDINMLAVNQERVY